MTIEEQIAIFEHNAEHERKEDDLNNCLNFRQLAEWLKDYKRLLVQEPTSLEKTNRWIPIKWHEITDEEREREGYPKEWACHLDSIMPYDGQRILITTKGGYVELDECYSDDGCTFSLDSGYDWVDDVVAWCELPEPYKASPTGAEGSEK